MELQYNMFETCLKRDQRVWMVQVLRLISFFGTGLGPTLAF